MTGDRGGRAEPEQLALLRSTVRRPAPARRSRDPGAGCRPAGGPGRRRRRAGPPRPAVRLPGARPTWPSAARPGVRVRVRFAGRLVDGYVVERVAEASEHAGRLAFLDKVVSPEPVLAPGGAASWPARSPTTTPARWPTCCGWPCRPGTPGPRPRAASDRAARPAASARTPGGWDALRHRARPARRRPRRCHGAGGLVGAARPDLARRAGPPGRHRARRRPRGARRAARPPRRRPGRRRADRAGRRRTSTWS